VADGLGRDRPKPGEQPQRVRTIVQGGPKRGIDAWIREFQKNAEREGLVHHRLAYVEDLDFECGDDARKIRREACGVRTREMNQKRKSRERKRK
jgi:hypothetical protein